MVLVSKKFDINKNLEILKLHADLVGEKLDELSTTVFYEKRKVVGYIVLIDRPSYVIIDWLYGPNYEKKIMEKIEKDLAKRHMYAIKLEVYLDPNEPKDISIKRLNFYLDLNYKVYDIKYTEDNCTILIIKKDIVIEE